MYCLHHPSGGDGIPDFGLFEQTLFRRGESPEWRAGIAPDRGVVEVKGADHRIRTLLDSDQVRERYLPAYGLVLATNLWQYRLVDETGRERERFDLANDEAGFWRLARGSRSTTLGGRFTDFLQRCLLARAAGPTSRCRFFPRLLCSRGADAARGARQPPRARRVTARHGTSTRHRFGTRNGEHLFASTAPSNVL